MRRRSLVAGGLAVAVGLVPATAFPAAVSANTAGSPAPRVAPTQVLGYTGSVQSYTVPSDTHFLRITALGGGGASGPTYVAGGSGAIVTTYQGVAPGQVLTVKVGGGGAVASAGGAATSVGGPTLTVVAGGGGGANGDSAGGIGAAAGTPAGGNGGTGGTDPGKGGNPDGTGRGGNGGNGSGGTGGGTGGVGSGNGQTATNGSAGGGGGGFSGGSGGSYFGGSPPGGNPFTFNRQSLAGGAGGGAGFGAGGGASGGGGYGGGGGGSNWGGGGAGGSHASPGVPGNPATTFAPGANGAAAGSSSAANGSVTIKPLLLQQLIRCGAKPKSPRGIKRNRTVRLTKIGCRTNAGKRIKVTASRAQGRLFKLIRKKHGTQIRTKSRKFNVTLYWKAPATADYAAYFVKRTYRVR